ncbi:hypothetical protein [Thalassobacillus sp. CUG 92003]|uniref:hypothetical protein n=1 Tax=Thalassobacillus sp. CUG 92003 TaxID=2736641 RepID=UPI0015E68FD8|nr:hypothetical protein [Thalassobacillus sp. CUG 92003]
MEKNQEVDFMIDEAMKHDNRLIFYLACISYLAEEQNKESINIDELIETVRQASIEQQIKNR